jgi:hypothetical protein
VILQLGYPLTLPPHSLHQRVIMAMVYAQQISPFTNGDFTAIG